MSQQPSERDRRRIDPADRRCHLIAIRLTASELRSLKDRAQRDGVSVSEAVRSLIPDSQEK